MIFQKNISLKPYNTFNIEALAKRFAQANKEKDLVDILKSENQVFILSGGSNILLTKDIEQPVIHLNLKGIAIDKQTSQEVWVSVKAGENWHQFVLWTLEKGFGGIENLSLIPGNVGTAPMQNIGAYGVEVKDVIEKVTFIEKDSLQEKTFTNKECEFGYRASIFKQSLKDKVIITKVQFKLTKQNHHLKTHYEGVQNILRQKNIDKPTPKNVSEAVIQIRKNKLPNPKSIGNAGSFFKNPVVKKSNFKNLLNIYPEMPHYTISEQEIKIPAGWLIEKIGYKGKRSGEVGVHYKQALVLVNYGNGTGKQVYALARDIQKNILKKFDIFLETEVNIL